VFVGDGGGHFPAARQPVVGSLQVARFVFGLLRVIPKSATGMRTEVVRVNDGLGIVVEATYQGGLFRSVMSFSMDGDRITGVFNQLNPEKVARVPAPTADGWPPPVPAAVFR
jgi:RNA polymerase sigma-70 factor (ECF subfamily)